MTFFYIIYVERIMWVLAEIKQRNGRHKSMFLFVFWISFCLVCGKFNDLKKDVVRQNCQFSINVFLEISRGFEFKNFCEVLS